MEKSIAGFEDAPRFSQRLVGILRRISWTTLLAGVALGMLGLHLLGNHSFNGRLTGLESEMQLVRASLNDVADTRAGVAEANDLLGELAEQQARLDSARASLAVIDRLSAEVSGSSTQADEAESVLERLIALNNELIATRNRQEDVAAAIDRVNELQSRVAGVGADSQQALKHVEEARRALAEFEQLKQRVHESSADLQLSRDALEAVVELQCDLAATDESTTQARAAAERLMALKDNLNAGSDQIESAEANAERLIGLKNGIAGQGDLQNAEQNAERLIGLQDQLVSDERLQFLEAASNVERLIRIQAEIAAQTDGLAGSITALEVLDDFQTEFNGQAAKVQDMRRQLTELILLQTTIDEVLRAIEPISELGNLRRLDTLEIQEAARVILDQRRARMARTAQPADVATTEAELNTDADVDPEETDVEIHSPEIHRPVPVPPEEL